MKRILPTGLAPRAALLALLASVALSGCPAVVDNTPDLADDTGPTDGPVVDVCGNRCAAPTGVCNPDKKRCVACVGDRDCPAATLCDSNGRCVAGCSASHSDCGDAGA